MLTNFHSHTSYCDGEGTPEDYVRMAIQKGLSAYGFTSHSPLPFPNEWSMKVSDAIKYVDEIHHLKTGYANLIDIYLGMEADFIPNRVDPESIKKEYNLDFVIGSVHYVKQFNSGVPWQIDGTPEDFERGFTEIFNRNAHSLINEYYTLIRQMITDSPPDIIGHIDKIKMHNRAFHLYDESDSWYQQEILKTLEVIRDSKCIVEINTRGLYKKKLTEPYPGKWILEKIHEFNIPIMINSDSHHPSEMIAGFKEMQELASAIGFTELAKFEKGNWHKEALTP